MIFTTYLFSFLTALTTAIFGFIIREYILPYFLNITRYLYTRRKVRDIIRHGISLKTMQVTVIVIIALTCTAFLCKAGYTLYHKIILGKDKRLAEKENDCMYLKDTVICHQSKIIIALDTIKIKLKEVPRVVKLSEKEIIKHLDKNYAQIIALIDHSDQISFKQVEDLRVQVTLMQTTLDDLYFFDELSTREMSIRLSNIEKRAKQQIPEENSEKFTSYNTIFKLIILGMMARRYGRGDEYFQKAIEINRNITHFSFKKFGSVYNEEIESFINNLQT